MLKHPHTGLLGRAQQTQRVFQRVQVARHLFIGRRRVTRTVDVLSHRIALGPAHLNAALAQIIGIAAQLPRLARAVGHVQVARLPIGVDAMLRHALLHPLHRLHRHLPSAVGVGLAQLCFERPLAAGVTHNRLPTVAPTGAAAHAVGFQQHHRQATLGQRQRAAQTRKAAAHHQHIGLQAPGQGGCRRRAQHTGLVIAALVELGVRLQQRHVHLACAHK